MATAKTKTELKVVEPPTGALVPDFLADRAKADAGKGVSQSADDNLVPLAYILQAQSPQCQSRNPDYIPGAQAGHIWLRNSGLPTIDGEEGFLFQPCFFVKTWVEWIPRSMGGGYAGVHDERPFDAVETPDPQNPDKMQWILPNKHEVKEVRSHVGYAIIGDQAFPYVIPMSGSGHTASRAWMFLMGTKTIGGERAPSWAALYRVKTKFRTNASGEWFTWDVHDAGWVQTEAEYNRGAALNLSFATGEKSIAAEDEEQPAGDPDTAAM